MPKKGLKFKMNHAIIKLYREVQIKVNSGTDKFLNTDVSFIHLVKKQEKAVLCSLVWYNHY